MGVYKIRRRIETPSCKLPRIICWFVIQARLDKENKMPSEAVSDGIFYFGARLGFLFAFPVLPPPAANRMMAEKLGGAVISIIIMRIN